MVAQKSDLEIVIENQQACHILIEKRIYLEMAV